MINESPILIFAIAFPPAYRAGGPIRTIEALVREDSSEFQLRVITSDRDLDAIGRLDVVSNEWTDRGKAQVWYASVNSSIKYLMGMHAGRKLKPSVIYLNSFFNPKFSIIPRIMGALGFFGNKNFLLAPRGEFSEGALQIKRGKKKTFILLYRLFRLDRRIFWHASSTLEAVDIRRVFPSADKILVKEDETSLPAVAASPTATSDRLKIVFFSRISPKKGLDVVLDGLTAYPATEPSVNLEVYGTEEDPVYVERCKRLVGRLPSNVTVVFKGPIIHGEARNVLRRFDFMVLPTWGENFGHVIAESLSVSVPVICSDTTPWTSVLVGGGGVVVRKHDPKAWCTTVMRLAQMSVETKHELKLEAGAAYGRWVRERDNESIFVKLDRALDMRRG